MIYITEVSGELLGLLGRTDRFCAWELTLLLSVPFPPSLWFWRQNLMHPKMTLTSVSC